MDENIPQLLCDECWCIPKKYKVELPPSFTVPLACGALRIDQTFGLRKEVIPRGRATLQDYVRCGIHFEFDAHGYGGLWDCFLILHDIVPYSGRDEWRCVRVGGQRLLVRQIRRRTWKNQFVIVGLDAILPAMGVLLRRHFRKVGLEGFNSWLTRLTPSGQTPRLIAVPAAHLASV